MANMLSFDSDRKFYCDKYFPYGLDRSGEFTRDQANLLIQHGWAYQTLAEGTRRPHTPDEEAFVAVCRHEKEPTTIHEKVWMLFCAKTSAQRAVSNLLVANEKWANKSSSEVDFDEDFE